MDKEDKQLELIAAENVSGLELVKDIIEGVDNNLFFLGYQNEIIEKKNGLLESWPSYPLFESHQLLTIYGQTQSGVLYLQSRVGFLMFFDKNDGARLVNSLLSDIYGRVRGLVFNDEEQFWIWSSS